MTEKMDGCNLVIQLSRLNYEARFIVFVFYIHCNGSGYHPRERTRPGLARACGPVERVESESFHVNLSIFILLCQ